VQGRGGDKGDGELDLPHRVGIRGKGEQGRWENNEFILQHSAFSLQPSAFPSPFFLKQ